MTKTLPTGQQDYTCVASCKPWKLVQCCMITPTPSVGAQANQPPLALGLAVQSIVACYYCCCCCCLLLMLLVDL